MAQHVVGLTGGIASGKSAAAACFRARGVPIIDADELAREVVAPGTDGLREIVAAFGDDVLLPDGSLDRKALGDLVFSDSGARRRLNAITHPRIAIAGAAKIASYANDPWPYVLYEAALLVENDVYKAFEALVVVAASPDVQLARLVERDRSDEGEARARISAQSPLEKKLEVADYVIWNDGDRAALDAEVERVHRSLVERFGGKQG